MDHPPAHQGHSNSVLVSLKELRNIETDRVDREREEGEQMELEREQREVRDRQQRAASERAEQARREQLERERAKQTEREAREERLRLAEAERRARVEAEMALEQRRIQLELAAQPRRAPVPWIGLAAVVLVMGGAIALLGHALHKQVDRNGVLLAELTRLERHTAQAKRSAEDRVSQLQQRLRASQLAALQQRAMAPVPSPLQGSKGSKGSKGSRPAHHRPPAKPLITLCADDDPICTLTGKKRRPR